MEDEIDLDDYIESQDEESRTAIGEAAAWVADQFYADRQTLASLRLRAKLTQKQLAVKCEVAQPHISRYESGVVEPRLLHAERMAVALGVSLDVLAEAYKNSSQ